MTNTYRELVIGGVLFAPVVSYAALAFLLFLLIRPAIRAVGFSRYFSNPAAAELGLYISMFGLLTLLL